MRALLHWCVGNSPAVTSVSVLVMLIGGYCAFSMQREFWPHAELNVIDVTADYPGASPEEVESAFCEKIEEAISGLQGVRRVKSMATSGRGRVSVELRGHLSDRDADEKVNQVRQRINEIQSLPENADRPNVRRRQESTTTMQLGVVGPTDAGSIGDSRWRLREYAERVRRELLELSAVSDAKLVGAPGFQIDIELSPAALEAHGISLQQAARRVREFSEEVAGGVLATEGQEVLVRGMRNGLKGEDFESIPMLTSDAGAQRRLGQLGEVDDGFDEATCVSLMDGRPAIAIEIDATESDDILTAGSQIREYMRSSQTPPGFELVPLMDRTDDVADRLTVLARSGCQGLLLVLLVLSLLLEWRLALWVAMGIPLALSGAAAVMYVLDQSLNMSSMFAILIALGIVVDDAIIVGENVFSHRQRGKSTGQAAIDGCLEVMPAVVTSVATTSIAFLPILLMTGRTGRMTHVMPLAVISVLAFSLAEALLFLPVHLSRGRSPDASRGARRGQILARVALGQSRVASGFECWAARVYEPLLRFCLANRVSTLAFSLGIFVISVAAIAKGTVSFSILPRMDWNFCTVLVKYPDGTSARHTEETTREIELALQRVRRELSLTGEDPVQVVHRTIGFATAASGESERGSHVGSLSVQLCDSGTRSVSSQQLVHRWREAVRSLPGQVSVRFAAGPLGLQSPQIEFKLVAGKEYEEELREATRYCSGYLADLTGVKDVSHNHAMGKSEFRVRLHQDAGPTGVTTGEIARALRAAVHGEEVTRLQRGRHEVPVRVRYAEQQRNSIADMRRVCVTLEDGSRSPISELATVEFARGLATIRRQNRRRAVTVMAEVDSDAASVRAVTKTLNESCFPELKNRFPGVHVSWDGERSDTRESMKRMRYGFLGILAAMYVLLTIQFRSHTLPLLVLTVIPLSLVGAVAGHFMMGLSLTLFSVYGIVALAGIVVNDSIILLDFANRQAERTGDALEAVTLAGRRRLRPILLTSLTTIFGLVPIMLESNRQSQVLVPMAVSIAFGLIASTFFVLVLIPTLYLCLPPKRVNPVKE